MTRPLTTTLLALALALAAPVAPAAETLAIGTVDAPSCSSDSAICLLDDGVTRVAATLRFEFDPVLGELVVVARNTSPVLPGLTSPLITEIHFNLPVGQVSGLELVEQVGSAGPAPDFSFSADLDLADGKNKLKAGCLGAFGVELDLNGIQGGIANAHASQLAGPPGAAVIGPVSFRFAVQGPDLDGLTSADFAYAQSVNPPGIHQVNAAMKFQGGEGASGKIGNGFLPVLSVSASGDPSLGGQLALGVEGPPAAPTVLAVSLDPGPTLFGVVPVPLGLPLVVVTAQPLSLLGQLALDVHIPNDPALADLTFHLAAVSLAAGGGVLDASPGLSVTILP